MNKLLLYKIINIVEKQYNNYNCISVEHIDEGYKFILQLKRDIKDISYIILKYNYKIRFPDNYEINLKGYMNSFIGIVDVMNRMDKKIKKNKIKGTIWKR